MRIPIILAALFCTIIVSACDEKVSDAPPTPRTLTADAIGHYCGMTLVEHAGPKGQILVAGRAEPVWFSSARDAFSFTLLPEESKAIRAIYVSDMAHAESWESPGAKNWIDARRAFFVIESQKKGGMGANETIPFSDRATAERFASENGGRVVTFEQMPREYVLGPSTGDTNTR